MTFYWLIAFILLLFIEIVTVNLVSIWFALGAIFSMIASLFTDNLVIQIVVFISVSIVSLFLTKPIVKKFSTITRVPTNLDRVIGKTAEVTKKITSDNYGEVKVMGTIWTATGKDVFEVGEKVVVNKIDGVKLVVTKKEEK